MGEEEKENACVFPMSAEPRMARQEPEELVRSKIISDPDIFNIHFSLQSFANIEDHGLSDLFTGKIDANLYYSPSRKPALSLTIDDSLSSIKFQWSYPKELFDDETIHDFQREYERIIKLWIFCKHHTYYTLALLIN